MKTVRKAHRKLLSVVLAFAMTVGMLGGVVSASAVTGGDGSAYFNFSSTGIQGNDANQFKNGSYINNEFYQYLTYQDATGTNQHAFQLDESKLLPGQTNTVSITIGNAAGDYNINALPNTTNYDDFTIGAFSATLPNGEVVAPASIRLYYAVKDIPAATQHNETTPEYSSTTMYKLGDGYPGGSDLTQAYRIDVTFDLSSTTWNHTPTDAAPVITAPATATVAVGAGFEPMAGVSAADDVDGDLTSSIQVSGSVDTAVAGTYTLTYTVSDSAGNTATATQVVTVSAPAVGDGHAYMDFSSNGIQPSDGFRDGTYINGAFYQYLTSNDAQQSVTLDPSLLQIGEVNTFSITIGKADGDYDVNLAPNATNYDDFSVSNFVLTLPNGETIRPTQVTLYTPVDSTTPAATRHNEITEDYSSATQYNMGDGWPGGSNTSLPYRIDFFFDLKDSAWDGSYTPIVPDITLKNVSLQIGADQTQRTVVWYSSSNAAGKAQIALKSAMTGGDFPAQHQEFSAAPASTNVTGFKAYQAAVTGLAANMEYVYRVGNDEGWSPVYSFQTQSFGNSFSFLAAGDPQIGVRGISTDVAGWTSTLNSAIAAFPQTSFLVSLGDQVQGAASEEQYEGLLSPDILKSMSLTTVVGNHDLASSYSQHFNMPNVSATCGVSASAGSGSGDYWYIYNNTLFLALNINNLSVSEHKSFMQSAIAANPDVKWKVVTEHFTLFSITNSGYWNVTQPLRDQLAPVFSELGIDVVLDGHDHSYMRSYLMNGTTPDTATGGSSVTNPGAGKVLYINANSASGSLYCGLDNSSYPFVAFKNQENVPNITKIDVTDASFTISTYRATDMSVVDTFAIHKTAAQVPSTVSTADSQWQYLDNNTDPGTAENRYAWTLPDFDDSAWKTAQGSFGAKNGGKTGITGGFTVNTLLNQYITGTTDVPAFFFRTEMNVADVSKVSSLTGSLVYDDAAIVYINGVKVTAFDEPAGGFPTNLSYGGSNEDAPKTGTINVSDTSMLVDGVNTIAVELHNGRASSSDVYFDFVQLTANTAPATSTVKNVVQSIGTDETQRNLTWYSNSTSAGKAQLALKSAMMGSSFPVAACQEFSATRGTSSVSGFGSYKATITGLVPGTEYVYRVGGGDGWSDVYTFKTQGANEFSFLFAGDPQIGSSGSVSNDTNGWNTTLNKVSQWFPDANLLISAGDQVEHAGNETEYDGFLAPEPFGAMTLAPNIGNHDSSGVNYKEHFTVPNAVSSTGDTNAGGDYWFSYNSVLFLSLNSNNLSTAQHKAFLEGAIQAYQTQNGGADPLWKVVTFHHSVYSTASHTTDSDILQRRNDLPPVLSELGIDAVLMGHDHVYTRSLMMNGTTPVTSGYTANGGDPYASYTDNPSINEVFYLTANSATGSKYYAIKNLSFPFMAAQNQENTPNITKIDVTENAMTFTTYRTGVNSTVGDVVDTFTLQRAPAPSITTLSLPDGAAGTAYSQTLVADGDMPITWSIASGSLPAGLTLNPTTGEISGTPTAAGVSSFTVRAANTTGSATREFSLTVSPAQTTLNLTSIRGASALMLGDDRTVTFRVSVEHLSNADVMEGTVSLSDSRFEIVGIESLCSDLNPIFTKNLNYSKDGKTAYFSLAKVGGFADADKLDLVDITIRLKSGESADSLTLGLASIAMYQNGEAIASEIAGNGTATTLLSQLNGDVNGNGSPSGADLSLALGFFGTINTDDAWYDYEENGTSKPGAWRADYDRDGEIDIVDLTKIAWYIAGMPGMTEA